MSASRTPKKSLAERIADADVLASRWLGDGNEAAEAGNHAKAQACYDKAQYWKDRFNLLSGLGDREPPKR
ncbi:TPA: hypothetical protein NNM78_002206 [Pseudomonas aeruginosa]|nr:hypothetical protein [Pseudomonas aeruginosa]